MPTVEDKARSLMLMIDAANRFQRAALDRVADPTHPVDPNALTTTAAIASAAINIGVRLGLVDFEMHDALVDQLIFSLAKSAGITLP